MATPMKPRVLLICTNSGEAGAPRHVETLVRLLRDNVDFILLFGEDGPVLRRLHAAGFDARLLRGLRSAISPVRDIALLRQLSLLVRDNRPDLIHCHSSKAGLLGRLAGRMQGVPVLFTIHGWSWASMSGRKSQLARLIERQVAHLRDVHYLYVCKAVAETGQEILSLRPGQGQVIYNGVPDRGRAASDLPGAVRFIMPARAAYPKDHETLIRAFSALQADSRLILCGAGTDTADFAGRIRTLAPRRHGDIIGLGQRSDVDALLQDAHVMVLSSRSEAMPLSIIEAMSFGLPVIASNVGGIPEQVTDDVTGFLVPPGDVAAMTAALHRMLDPATRRRMGHAGRQRYEADFSAPGMARATMTYYLNLILSRAEIPRPLPFRQDNP